VAIPEIVRSRSHPLVKRLRALRAGREPRDVVLLEGWRLIDEALDSGMEVTEVAIAEDASADRIEALTSRLAAGRAGVRNVSRDVLAALSETETSQGVLAVARRPAFDEERMFRGTPLLLVAVAIQNPGNVGALLRAAEAAGATGAYFTAGSADPMSWKALRGSMGSAFRVPHVAGLEAADTLARLSARGVTTVAAAATQGDRYDAVDLTGPVALLLGNEGAGLPADLAARADRRITIPMSAPVESLNVAVAAGILLFEAGRQRRR
jgi:TrmH family RNA methyltransferase